MLNQEQQILEQINQAKNILIVFGENGGGDALASSLALFLFLKKLDKNPEIVSATGINSAASRAAFNFLPSFKEIKDALKNSRQFIISLDTSLVKVSEIKYKKEEDRLDFIITPKEGYFSGENVSAEPASFAYDLIIVLGESDLESLGTLYDNNVELFLSVPLINIDRRAENEKFGQINLIDLTAAASAEILFYLLEKFSREAIDEDIATSLLAGIISATKNFRAANVTPSVLTVAAQLLSMGGRREEIVNHLYRSRQLGILKLWGRVLARLSGNLNNTLAWSLLTKADFQKTETRAEQLKEVAEELIASIPEVKAIVLIYEDGASKPASPLSQAMIITVKNLDARYLSEELNPRGDKNLAYAVLNKSLPEAEKEIIGIIKERMEKISKIV